MNTLEAAPRDGQVARLLGAAGKHHGIELGNQLFWGDAFVRVAHHALAGRL